MQTGIDLRPRKTDKHRLSGSAMDWPLTWTLAGIGALIGILSVLGFSSPGVEPFLWSVAAVVWIGVVRRRQPKAQFQHILTVGILAGLLASAVQVLFFSTYLSNQAEAAEAYRALPTAFPVTAFLVLSGLVKGALFGGVVGGVALLLDRILDRSGRPPRGAHAGSSGDDGQSESLGR